MSDISTVSTKIASGSTQSTQKAGSESKSGVFASGIGGGNFWDMIAAQFSTTVATQKTGAGVTNENIVADNGKAPVKSDNPLALLQIALSSQTVDADGNIVLSTAETAAEKLQSQLDITNSLLNHLKNVVPDNGEKEGILASILGKLQTKSDTLQASLSALENPVITKGTAVEDIPMPLLNALGLKN